MSSYKKVKEVAVKINLQLALYKKARVLRMAVWEMSKDDKAKYD